MTAYPWDYTLSISGGSTYGFMCSTPKGGTKQLSVTEGGMPNPNRIAAEASVYQEFDPTLDVPYAQDTLAGGLGQLVFDGGSPNRYWWGSAFVSHVGGKGYLAPPVVSTTLATTTALPTNFATYRTTAGVQYDFTWSGVYLYRRPATDSSTAWTLVYTAGFPITDFDVFNGVGVICTPSNTVATEDFFTQADVTAAATWTPTARNHAAFSNGTKPKYMVGVRDSLFAAVDNNKVYYATDPTTDAWVGPIATNSGDSGYLFTGGVAANDFLYWFKPNVAISIDADQNVAEILWEWKDKPTTENFKHFASHDGLLIYSVGPEVFTYDPVTGQNFPTYLARQDGFSVEAIYGVAADNQYIYTLAKVRVPKIRSEASIALMRGVRIGLAQVNWECLWEDTTIASDTFGPLFAAPFGVGTRLYWGWLSGSTSKTYIMEIPPGWDESTSGSFATSGTLYTSISRGNFPGFVKRLLWVGLTSQDTDSTKTISIAYSLDGGATFTALGTVTADGLRETAFSNVSSREVVLRFTLASTGTSTPVMNAYDLHQRVRFRYLPHITASARVAENVELRNGSRETRLIETQRANLETLRTTDSQVTYEDFLGNSFPVSVDHVSYRPTRHEEPDDAYEIEAVLEMTRSDRGT